MIRLWLLTGLLLAAVRSVTPVLPASSSAGGEGGLAGIVGPAKISPDSYLDWSDAELWKQVESDPTALGSLSIGTPGSGALINGVSLPPGPGWEVIDPGGLWGTSETMTFIRTVIGKVQELFPETFPLTIGDISVPDGGRMKLHTTHQAGRDVDFGFYYKTGPSNWFVPGTAANMDLPRNWALLRALLLCTDVETILLDSRVQRLLYDYALKISEDKAWLDRVFQFAKGSANAVVCHVSGHRNHYHVRFFNRTAQELGRRAYPYLIQLKKIKPPVFTLSHLVRAGETLGHLAVRYGSSIRAIQQINGLATTMIQAGRAYRIPLKGVAAPPVKPVVVRARPLPPGTPAALAAVEWPTPQSLYGDRLARLAKIVPPLSGSLLRI
jgi:penicillin-insensitive murein endopeptidase